MQMNTVQNGLEIQGLSNFISDGNIEQPVSKGAGASLPSFGHRQSSTDYYLDTEQQESENIKTKFPSKRVTYNLRACPAQRSEP